MYIQSASDSALTAAIVAVSLANINGRIRSSKIEGNGRKEYGAALKLTKEALEDPLDQKRDETLLAIYLLGMYEVIQYPKHNRGSWGVHLDGAVALIRAQTELQSPSLSSPSCALIARLVTWQMVSPLKTCFVCGQF